MSFQVATIFTAVNRLKAPLREMMKGVRQFALRTEVLMHRVDRSFINLGRRVNALTGNFGLLLGLSGVISVFRTTIGIMSDFETGLVVVGKRAGIANEELEQFGKDIRGVSRELNAVVGTEKLLEMAGAGAALGVDGSANLLKFSETLAKLETATNVVGEEGAASIARILKVTGDGIEVVDRFGASLVALGNNSAATETEILEVANEVARSTAPFKLGSQAVLGISAALKSVGVQAQGGGSGVGRFFKELEQAVFTGKNLQNFSKVLNLTGDEISRQFRQDASRLFVPFVKGLQRISEEGGSVNSALQSMGIDGQIAFKGLAPLAAAGDLVAESMALSSQAFEDNLALQHEFNAASRTIKSAMAAVVNEFKNIITETATANNGFSIVSRTLFFVKNNLKLVLQAVVLLTAGYVTHRLILIGIRTATIAYNVALAVNNILQGKSLFALRGAALAMRIQATVMKVVTAAQWAWNAAMTANPIGLIIAAIAALGLAIHQITDNWNEWGAAVSLAMGPLGALISLLQSIERNWTSLTDAFKTGGILNGFRALGLVIVDAVLQPIEQLFSIIRNISGIDFGVERLTMARQEALRRLDLAAANQPFVPPPPAPAPAFAPIGIAAPPQQIDIPTLQSQLFNDQLTSTVNTQGKVEISVKDDTGRLNVDTTGLTDNVDVEVTQGFTFSAE